MVICIFGTVEVLQHKHIAIGLHLTTIILEFPVPITYKSFLFHGLVRPFSGLPGYKMRQADTFRLSIFILKPAFLPTHTFQT